MCTRRNLASHRRTPSCRSTADCLSRHLVHFWIMRLGAVLVGAGRADQRRASTMVLTSSRFFTHQQVGDRLRNLLGQLVRFPSMSQTQIVALIGCGTVAWQAGEVPRQWRGALCGASFMARSLGVSLHVANAQQQATWTVQHHGAINAPQSFHGTTCCTCLRNSHLRVFWVERFRPRSDCCMGRDAAAPGTHKREIYAEATERRSFSFSRSLTTCSPR